MKSIEPRVFEYKIKYNVDVPSNAMNSHHYYMACTVDQAVYFHEETMKRRKAVGSILCVEWYNPWANRWEDQSNSIKQTKHLPIRHENN